MKSCFGKNIKVEIFGGSHEKFIGVTMKNFPVSSNEIDMEKLQIFLNKRAPGNDPLTTARKEADIAELYSDNPLTFRIKNTNIRPADYKNLAEIPRPGHADYTAYMKYGGKANMSGGGPFSARMTAPLCIAGGIALQYLEKKGVAIHSHILSIGKCFDDAFNPLNPETAKIDSEFPVLNPDAKYFMQENIKKAISENDSLGGIIEVAVTGMPVGIGGAMYDGLESLLSPIYFGIPAVKGVEFGIGFKAAHISGSQNNDAFEISGGKIMTKTNNAGGILGGISSGMPIIARLAFKPTPSIAMQQNSVNLRTMQPCKLTIKGRHDPCVVLRAVPVVTAATALGILDAMTEPR